MKFSMRKKSKGAKNNYYEDRHPWLDIPEGYARFAAFIANDDDKATAIYRRFDRLAHRVLLYHETRLSDLEKQLHELDQMDKAIPELQHSAKNLAELEIQASCLTDIDPEHARAMPEREWDYRNELAVNAQKRLDLMRDIQKALKEYYKALKLEADILGLHKPDRKVLAGLRNVFKNENQEQPPNVEHEAMITGSMETHLDDDKDLCVVSQPLRQDRLTRLLEGYFASQYLTRTRGGGITREAHTKIKRFVNFVTILLAACFLFFAIIGLFFAPSKESRLGIMMFLVVAFAACVGLLTNARRQDIFIATALYATVLMVYVSGDFSVQTDRDTGSIPMVQPAMIITQTVTSSTIISQATEFIWAQTTLAPSNSSSSETLTISSPVSSSSSNNTTDPVPVKQSGLALGAKVGIITAVVTIAMVMSLIAFVFWRHRKGVQDRRKMDNGILRSNGRGIVT